MDFGLADWYVNENSEHVEQHKTSGDMRGTIRYASINKHNALSGKIETRSASCARFKHSNLSNVVRCDVCATFKTISSAKCREVGHKLAEIRLDSVHSYVRIQRS